VAVAHLFENRPADADGRRAALAAAVARIAGADGATALSPASLLASPAAPLTASPSSAALLSPSVSPPPSVSPGAVADDGRAAIAVPEPLAALVPGGVRRGEALALSGGATGHATVDYLSLALLAAALRQGLWCAAVGAAGLGGAALTGLLGAPAVREGALRRLLLVAEPGEQWAEVAAVLADGVDLLLVRPPGAVSAQVARRVDARLRQGVADAARHRAALLVLGSWPSARTVLRVRRLGWSGLAAGTGHLAGGRAEITAEDRARRVRTVRIWLPAADGADGAAGAAGAFGTGEREEAMGTRRLTAVA
jgi:hypothetical protein